MDEGCDGRYRGEGKVDCSERAAAPKASPRLQPTTSAKHRSVDMNVQWQPQRKKRYGLVKGNVFKVEEAVDSKRDEIEARRRAAERKAVQVQRAALEEDASIYDYDAHYEQQQPSPKVSRQARYIPKLQQAAKIRDMDFDRVYERQLLKEQVDDGTERFVTAAYKQQLQESRKWDAHDRVADAIEKKTTAESAGMHGFYSNLLTKNVGMGADVEKNAVSAYTHDSAGHRVLTGDTRLDDVRQAAPAPTLSAPPTADPVTGDTVPAPATADAVPATADAVAATADAVPVPTTADTVSSARERYLARKRAKLEDNPSAPAAKPAS